MNYCFAFFNDIKSRLCILAKSKSLEEGGGHLKSEKKFNEIQKLKTPFLNDSIYSLGYF